MSLEGRRRRRGRRRDGNQADRQYLCWTLDVQAVCVCADVP